MTSFTSIMLYLTILAIPYFTQVAGHGRLLEPPGRGSMWRKGFSTPTDYDDNSQYCGGFAVQQSNGGKCGFCGDAYGGAYRNEGNGKFATTKIGRTYTVGQIIDVQVELTAAHKGFYEFYLCVPRNFNEFRSPTSYCNTAKVLLKTASGTTSVEVDTARLYNIRLQLPPNEACAQCLLQWRYRTGNNWGPGPQEEFYNCANIAIGGRGAGPRPVATSAPKPVATYAPKPVATYAPRPVATYAPRPAPTAAPAPASGCRGISPWGSLLDAWCKSSCKRGSCPPSHCKC